MEIVEFLDQSFEAITKEIIRQTLVDKVQQLATDGLVITSSYGTAAFLHSLCDEEIDLPHLIVIDGLGSLPTVEELKELVADKEEDSYRPKLSKENMRAYLSLYVGQSSYQSLEKLVSKMQNKTIFSSESVPIPSIELATEDHLLMVPQPQTLLAVLAK